MGNRFMPAETKVFGRKPRRFRAIFQLDAANDPTIVYPASLAAAGFVSAVHFAAGQFLFKLADVWPDAFYESGATYAPELDNVDLYPQSGVFIDSDGLPALLVRLKTGAVSTDPPASPNGGRLTVWLEVESSPNTGS